jgi:hypothetical protein
VDGPARHKPGSANALKTQIQQGFVVPKKILVPVAGANWRGHLRRKDQVMKDVRTYASLCVKAVGLLALLLIAMPRLAAQQDAPPIGGDADDKFNPPPCDFNDTFYNRNGIDVTQLDSVPGQRFGFNHFRQFGPPARNPNQANWVVDNTCTQDPTRNNIRILATTGGYVDDGTGSPTDFISIIAFVTNQNFFLPAPTGFALPTPPAPPISDTDGNARNIHMLDIASHFEAYAANKQTLAHGVIAPTPCGSMGDPTLPAGTPCFPVTSVATPTLRQDWRFATNRNAIDGSDGNDPLGNLSGTVSSSPFGYFCDDLLGMWIITYFWYTDASVGNPAASPSPITAQCTSMLAQLASMHGTNLDGTPNLLTANELNFLEGKDVGATPLGPGFPTPPSPACTAEGQEAQNGSDGGAIWLICPAIPDPRAGGIAPDAFLDTVRRPNGVPLDIHFNLNFACLKIFGAFCSELTPAQRSSSQLTSAAAAN